MVDHDQSSTHDEHYALLFDYIRQFLLLITVRPAGLIWEMWDYNSMTFLHLHIKHQNTPEKLTKVIATFS